MLTFSDNPSILAQLSMILCWYWLDEKQFGDETDANEIGDLIKKLPRFLRGEQIGEHFTWLIWDALGTYSPRSEELEALYQRARKEWGVQR